LRAQVFGCKTCIAVAMAKAPKMPDKRNIENAIKIVCAMQKVLGMRKGSILQNIPRQNIPSKIVIPTQYRTGPQYASIACAKARRTTQQESMPEKDSVNHTTLML
jgi:hypothetical protein